MDARSPTLAPRAHKRPFEQVHHGIRRNDPYRWLRAENWQQVMREPDTLDAEIRAYLEAENAYCSAKMEDTAALREALYTEMRGRIKEDDSSVPVPDGPFAYYVSYQMGAEHPRYCRMPREGGEETILLDGEILARGESYFRLGGISRSPDHMRLAYCTDVTGGEFYTIRVRDIATGENLPDEVMHTTGAPPIWTADGTSFLYVWNDDNHRPCRVYRHRLGTAQADDELVFDEPDPGFFVSVSDTRSREWIVIDIHDHQTTEAWLLDAANPDAGPRLVEPRSTDHQYSLGHYGDRLVILTNSGESEDFRIVEAPLDNPNQANWREIVPHVPGRLILAIDVYRDFLVRLEREDGLPRIVIRALSGGEEHAISFSEEAYSLGMGQSAEFETTVMRFVYSSMTTPSQVFDYDMRSRERLLRKTEEVPSGHDPGNYVTRRIHATAADGEMIPVSLLHHRTTPIDGTAPCLLYGYGAYGITIPAAFSTNRLSLVDRGFVYAIAHVRGGKDKGYRWYLEGKRTNKINTFTDFIAVGEHLVAQGYSGEGRIVAHGGSAGGLLVGAVANMAPRHFGAIIAEVPFVDVLNTMLDASLPLTPPEWPEWGNPIDSADDYRTIASYSPYDNIVAQAYPHILALAGISDPRVTYWEPAKWVARLRETKSDDNLLLLRTNMEAGHAGASGRFDRLHEVALVYAFALKVMLKHGVKPTSPSS